MNIRGQSAKARYHLGFFERLFEVPNDVIDIFNADRQPDEARIDAGSDQLFVGQMAMGGACRVQYQGAHIGDMDSQ